MINIGQDKEKKVNSVNKKSKIKGIKGTKTVKHTEVWRWHSVES